jgi:membrane protease YdiL (CAAX protease family)
MEKREFPEPIEALVLILLTFGFIFSITLIITLVALFFKTNSVLEGNTSVLFIIGGIIFLVVPIMYVKMREYNAQKLFRLTIPPNETLLLSVPIGISIAVLADELDRIVQIFLPTPDFFVQYIETMQADSVFDWILLLLGVVIIASLSEEILFRGFLQVSLERKGDITRAVILSSVSWTIIHVNPYWAIQIFITGVLLFLSLLIINFDFENIMQWYSFGDHVSPVVLVISAAVLFYCVRKISLIYTYPQEIK